MILSEVLDKAKPQLLEGTLHRIVESQTQVATNQLCDSFEEADILESMLDEISKPKNIPGTEGLHYLLSSPWRYPPLKYGSRFGSYTERSLFYGSKREETCLAESAFYRLKFFQDMTDGLDFIRTSHTVFEVCYRTERGLELQNPPFSQFVELLTDKVSYGPCQLLGAGIREAGIEAIEFISARDPSRGENVALFSPVAFASKEPQSMSKWSCLTSGKGVSFSRDGRPSKVVSFLAESFFHNGVLPKPAE